MHAARCAPACIAVACLGGHQAIESHSLHQLKAWRTYMKKLALCALITTAVLTTGCASILNEKTQQVNVSSTNGKNIKGTIDGIPFTAPGIVSVQRTKAAKVVVTETEGCAKQTAVESNVDPKFFINVLSGGAFGSTTDYATEKMWKYSENIVISCQ
jgi:hypothetical protein